jgi:hypothetical protein
MVGCIIMGQDWTGQMIHAKYVIVKEEKLCALQLPVMRGRIVNLITLLVSVVPNMTTVQ